jgi:mono/diheme cytochrome c family protein
MKAPFVLPMVCWLAGVAAAAEPVDYVRDIKPLFGQRCTSCHGSQKQKSGLRLDTAAGALHGGDSGPAVLPGHSRDSRLIQAVTGAGGVTRMPPKDPRLTAAEVGLLQAWIDQGAHAPADERSAGPDASLSNHWAFRPPVHPAAPVVKNTDWIRNAIDRFVLARLEKDGLSPSAEADRITLIRRLSLDLLGLPPTPRDGEAFAADDRADAYERLVDRLLASPNYGERWGRHWLDLARYADSNGFNIDAPRSMWKYRDWVIDAYNRDLPFDRFTVEQIAGDLLPLATTAQQIATGFHRNTLLNEEGGIDFEQFRVESLVDRVNTTGAVFLGLTVGCAQCHDHKFDPLTQREYYRLLAFYNSADEPALEVPTPDQLRSRAAIRSRTAAIRAQLRDIDTTSPEKQRAWERGLSFADLDRLPRAIRAIVEIPEVQRSAKEKETLAEAYAYGDHARHLLGGLGHPLALVTAANWRVAQVRSMLEKAITDLHKSEPAIVTTLIMRERPTPRATHVHLGGDFLRKGVPVAPGVPAVLHPLPPAHRSGGPPDRLDLARWLVDPHNPLTPRVVMNRFWQHYFGLGLVETENDFGTQGTAPTHPALMDWLATEFVARGWSMKAMHRLIVTSATYRQSSHNRPELAAIDPRNRILARQNRIRLDAEVVRDAGLAASGLFCNRIGGPSVFPPQPDGVFRLTQIQREWKADSGPDRYRRGMYTHFWRSAPHPALTVFDAPESTTTCTRRNRSNTPLQALTLLNDQAFFDFAKGLATRVLHEPATNDRERLHRAFRLCLARPPCPAEEERLGRLLAEFQTQDTEARLPTPSGIDATKWVAWVMVARVLLNLDEFITRE